MSMMPWPDLLRASAMLGVLPCAFWALSVREWRALIGENQAIDGARLAELQAAFPDSALFCAPPFDGGAVEHSETEGVCFPFMTGPQENTPSDPFGATSPVGRGRTK